MEDALTFLLHAEMDVRAFRAELMHRSGTSVPAKVEVSEDGIAISPDGSSLRIGPFPLHELHSWAVKMYGDEQPGLGEFVFTVLPPGQVCMQPCACTCANTCAEHAPPCCGHQVHGSSSGHVHCARTLCACA